MSRRKYGFLALGYALSICFLATALATLLVSHYAGRLQFDLLHAVCDEMVEQEPEIKRDIAAALKEYVREHKEYATDETARRNVLSELGYSSSNFSYPLYRHSALFVTAGLLAGTTLFLCTFLYGNKMKAKRIRGLADYLEQVNIGEAGILSPCGEDEFSKLEDEIYKTVTFLYQTKDAAVHARNDFAENLSNIAHQIKTPITAISLAVQTMQQEYETEKLEQIQKQLARLTHLEEALLILARLDAGTLILQREEIDIFTLLTLAADNLQELLAESDTTVHIPELGEMAIPADLDWTMEAVMNVMKDCMEHNPGGVVYCFYEQNPLYTEIRIWDEGPGFAKEDIPHLFERFYRGQHAREGGVGIGLALAKELIQRQNGTIRAKNVPEGGACFEIRFYRH